MKSMSNAPTTTPFASVTGVLLIGSAPLFSTAEALTQLTAALPNRLLSIPDGETGEARRNYIDSEIKRFPREALKPHFGGLDPPPAAGHKPISIFTLDDVKPTEYGTVAVQSYRTFTELRKHGVIPTGVRLQVSLPLPFAPVQVYIRAEFREQLELLYEIRMREAVTTILSNIPADDLAIQLDLAVEVMALDRVERFVAGLPADVALGFHFCYGDRDHKHFIEPEDLGVVVDFANGIQGRLKRDIHWMHLPVPRDRDDEAYFEPLRRLVLRAPGNEVETKLYLGIVHANDEGGTKRRIQTASKFVERFGVATECGLGRTPVEELDSILQISREVSGPANCELSKSSDYKVDSS
ncbi:hypothetical protein BJY01DRAFT_250477 [Aspergillus pseudoustus]|uniref:Uncharacterized protein n=1 Tax=Aspergillus pseudoustus TaxID=1810923 RepID=A0ABR4JHK5_9EURO